MNVRQIDILHRQLAIAKRIGDLVAVIVLEIRLRQATRP